MQTEQERPVSPQYLDWLEHQVSGLKILFEISSVMSTNLDLDILMPLVMSKAKEVMAAEACTIMLYNSATDKLEFEVALTPEANANAGNLLKKMFALEMGQGIAGWVAQNRQILVIDDVQNDPRFFRQADRLTGFTTKNMVAAPLVGRSGLIGVVQIINHSNKNLDPEIFQLLCGQFAIAIENARFHRDSIERERHHQQLEIAATIQKSFLPSEPVIKNGNAIISAFTISASEVGGDVYDFVTSSSKFTCFLIGDVSGKGISAALYMAKFISDFRHLAPQFTSPAKCFENLNLQGVNAPMGMFLTATYGRLDTESGKLQLVVAGHPPFIRLLNGNAELVQMPCGPPLGIIPSEYPETELQLSDGERLIFLTDGVFDAKNQAGDRFGLDDIVTFARNNADSPDLLEKIAECIKQFADGAPQADDLTLLELCWKKESSDET